MSVIIGLGGAARAGKDEVARRLAQVHGFTVMGMSDALCEALVTLNPIVDMTREGHPLRFQELIKSIGYGRAKEKAEVRRLLQVFGTDVGRAKFGEDVWCDATARRIVKLIGERQGDARVVVTGIRYPNEIAMIERLGGFAVYVNRSAPDYAPPLAGALGAHSSERSLDQGQFEHTIENDGTLAELYRKVDEMADILLGNWMPPRRVQLHKA